MSFIRIKICMGKLQFLHQPRLQGAARFHSVSALEEYKYSCIVSVVETLLFNSFVLYTSRSFMYKCHYCTDSCADGIRTTKSIDTEICDDFYNYQMKMHIVSQRWRSLDCSAVVIC
jgi:hypothetical protein